MELISVADINATTNVPQFSETAGDLCDKAYELLNTHSGDCSGSSVSYTSNFSSATADFTLSTGARVYNLSSVPSPITKLDGETAYTVYVDVNGDRGETVLYEDVFPFFITLTGVVIPDFDGTYGGEDPNCLSASIIYDYNNTDGTITPKYITDYKSVSYRDAACASGTLTYSSYCSGHSVHTTCTDSAVDCRMMFVKPSMHF